MAFSFTHDVVIRYRPYRLDPDTPPGGRDRAATLARKIPDPEQRKAIREALETAMADAGLSFDPGRPARLPDSTNAHRLVRWAHETGHQHAVMAGLFEAYWHHGEDVSAAPVLTMVAETAGMDPTEIEARLATSEDIEAVREEAASFRGGGVDGVPTFIVGEQTGFAGALPKAQMLDALKTLAADQSA